MSVFTFLVCILTGIRGSIQLSTGLNALNNDIKTGFANINQLSEIKLPNSIDSTFTFITEEIGNDIYTISKNITDVWEPLSENINITANLLMELKNIIDNVVTNGDLVQQLMGNVTRSAILLNSGATNISRYINAQIDATKNIGTSQEYRLDQQYQIPDLSLKSPFPFPIDTLNITKALDPFRYPAFPDLEAIATKILTTGSDAESAVMNDLKKFKNRISYIIYFSIFNMYIRNIRNLDPIQATGNGKGSTSSSTSKSS